MGLDHGATAKPIQTGMTGARAESLADHREKKGCGWSVNAGRLASPLGVLYRSRSCAGDSSKLIAMTGSLLYHD
jgi:hypothetical protein